MVGVAGSIPIVPTKQINSIAVLRVCHSDNSSPAHSDKFSVRHDIPQISY
jgi:hypothetical protein